MKVYAEQLKGQIVWADGPPLPRKRFYPILHVSPQAPLRCIILSERIVGVMTHFVDGRTKPCIGRDRGCVCAGGSLSTKFRGYAAVLLPEVGKVGLVELTAEAVRSCPDLTDPAVNLRGQHLRVWRLGKAKNSRCHAELQGIARNARLPPAPDVADYLVEMWGELPVLEEGKSG